MDNQHKNEPFGCFPKIYKISKKEYDATINKKRSYEKPKNNISIIDIL